MHSAQIHPKRLPRGINRLASASVALLLYILCASSAIAERPIDNPLLALSVTQIAAAYGDTRTYEITRNGKPVGTHVMRFEIKDEKVVVSVDSSITVRFLGVPVFRFAYVAEEMWFYDRLMSASATTTENGESSTVSFNDENKDEAEVRTHFVSNHWHPGVLTGDTVFNTLSGETSNITVTVLGTEQVDTGNGVVAATHYQYQDDINADVWYDEDGLWLKMEFAAEDGSIIRYLRSD